MQSQPLDQYRQIKLIGEGAAGRVYKVGKQHQDKNNQLYEQYYAKKVIPYQIHAKQSILNQIKFLNSLNHPHIIKTYEFYDDGTHYNFIMEYCNEGDIRSIAINQDRKEKIMNIIAMIVSGVKYLHEQKVVHRDLKPYNILMKDGIVKIVDFGISKNIKQNGITISKIDGTPDYLAPQNINSKFFDEKVDIWALGVIFLELLSNKTIKQIKQGFMPICYDPQFPNQSQLSQIKDQIFRKMVSQMLLRETKSRLNIRQIWEIVKDYYPKEGYKPKQSKSKIQKQLRIFLNNTFYEGELKQELFHGFGTFFYQNGDRYEGQWQQGKENGKGIFFYSNGNRYEGQYKQGIKDGKGIYFYNNGQKYQGQWINGVRSGTGVYFANNGNRYQGQFKDGIRHGKGVYFYNNPNFKGDTYSGQWKDGKQHGKGTYLYNNGNFKGDKYEGQWKDGKQNGSGVYYSYNGSKFQGQFKDGIKHGKGTYFYSNGDRFQGQWNNGNRNGKGIYYNKINGKKNELIYQNGKQLNNV